jgi:MoxR-like ATPase
MTTVLAAPRTDPRDDLFAVRDAIIRVIRGKDDVVDAALYALLARGHLLIEDIPGVGKSTLAHTLARAVGGDYRRIQFTSDLLPADIIGITVLRPGGEPPEFRPGPLFASFVLADEINRAPPRTQSALLEAMGEQTVSVDGKSHELPAPFMVLATQNPSEHHGTYPLPESQRDRFTLRLTMGYAGAEVESALLRGDHITRPADITSVTTPEAIIAAQLAVERVFVHPDLASYAQRIVQATREHPAIRLGVSTRGALAWIAVARARAWMEGRGQIGVDDLQELAVHAIAHRILVTGSAGDASAIAAEHVREIVATVPVPR